MSDRLFTPTYFIDGVEYRGKPRMGDDVGIGGGKTLDPNRYATKKTIAQGMLDIALLTANASQLKYVLQVGDKHEFYSLMLGLIVTSLVLQLLSGVMSLSLTMCSDCNLHNNSYRIWALFTNHFNLVNVFVIAVLNIIIAAFGVFPSSLQALPSDGI